MERRTSQNALATSPGSAWGYFLVVLRISAILCEKKKRKNVGSRASQTRLLRNSPQPCGSAVPGARSGHRPTRFHTGLSSPFES